MSAKKAVDVSIHRELLDAALAEDINLSATLEAALVDQLSIRRRARWLTESAAAINDHHRDVEETGALDLLLMRI